MDCSSSNGTNQYNTVQNYSSFYLGGSSGNVYYNNITNNSNVDTSYNSGDFSSNTIQSHTNLLSGVNQGSINKCTFIGYGAIAVNMSAGTPIDSCYFEALGYTINPNVSLSGEIITKLGSTVKGDVDAAANYSGGVLTLPAYCDYLGTINFTTSVDKLDAITNLAGATNNITPFKFTCSDGIAVHISNTSAHVAPSTGSIYSDNPDEIISGYNASSDFIEYQAENNIFKKINDKFYI